MAGRPNKAGNGDMHNKMKQAKSILRKSIREANALARESKMRTTMNSEINSKSFHSLIKLQRKSNCGQTSSLVVDGVSCESPKEICDGWMTHFDNLATPKQNHNWDQIYASPVETDLSHIENICIVINKPVDPASSDEIKKAL